MYVNIHTYSYPDSFFLQQKIEALLSKRFPVEEFKIEERTAFKQSSTYPAEVVKCLVNGDYKKFFIKYSDGLRDDFDSRGGIEYESRVYEKILGQTGLLRPVYHGIGKMDNDHNSMLILGFLDDHLSLENTRGLEYFLAAAEWIGTFHKISIEEPADFIEIYNERFYDGWVERALGYWHPTGLYPWLPQVAEHFRSQYHLLLEERSFIHAEYFPSNILITGNRICPIDWESAAIGCGEIDLACLIEVEKEEDSLKIIDRYIETRFVDAEFDPEKFYRKLLLAQMYLQFRYLLPKQKKKKIDMREKRFARLHSLALKAGVIK